MRNQTWSKEPLLEQIIKRSKVHEKNMSHEPTLNFDKSQTLFKNYKPIRILLWLVYRVTVNNYRSVATFRQIHSNSKEISYLLWQNKHFNLKTTCYIKPQFFLWSKLFENSLFTKYLIYRLERAKLCALRAFRALVP